MNGSGSASMMAIGVVAVLLVAAAAGSHAAPVRGAGQPPCYGDLGTSYRGVDVGYGGGSAFSSTHHSRWNFTQPWLRMRYDVFSWTLADNSYTESHHLFVYDHKVRFTWFNESDGCVQAPQPTTVYECIPASFTAVDYHTVVGVNTTKWVDKPSAPTAAQVSTNDRNPPILSSIIAYDSNGNVEEFVQIQDYMPTFDTPNALVIPEFCVNAPVVDKEQLNALLPTATRRIHELNEREAEAAAAQL